MEFSNEMKKGSMELIILSLLEERTRHGYEIGKLIEQRSGGSLSFRLHSLYPTLCRMEDRGVIQGRWVEKKGERRRRFYRLTAAGKSALGKQRESWIRYTAAVNQIVGIENA